MVVGSQSNSLVTRHAWLLFSYMNASLRATDPARLDNLNAAFSSMLPTTSYLPVYSVESSTTHRGHVHGPEQSMRRRHTEARTTHPHNRPFPTTQDPFPATQPSHLIYSGSCPTCPDPSIPVLVGVLHAGRTDVSPPPRTMWLLQPGTAAPPELRIP
ncbi:hypothetical protein C8T65DRAFT_19751 [Cerioporus squamosus]|nr:hypothetical protein C8T65DRAFT_19751 [Cerioporus squamosus]